MVYHIVFPLHAWNHRTSFEVLRGVLPYKRKILYLEIHGVPSAPNRAKYIDITFDCFKVGFNVALMFGKPCVARLDGNQIL